MGLVDRDLGRSVGRGVGPGGLIVVEDSPPGVDCPHRGEGTVLRSTCIKVRIDRRTLVGMVE